MNILFQMFHVSCADDDLKNFITIFDHSWIVWIEQ